MKEYQSNSYRSREESAKKEAPKKKVEKVIKGTAKIRENKKRKITDMFISEDVSNVKSYIFGDVLVPAIKDAVSDIVKDAVDMLLFGRTDHRRSDRGRSGNKVPYYSYSRERREDRRESEGYSSRNRFDYEDVVMDSRAEAETVRRELMAIIEEYGVATVLDLYDLVGQTAPHTSSNWGWTNVRNAEPIKVRDGYVLRLPKAMPID